jgi:hypothetical protein
MPNNAHPVVRNESTPSVTVHVTQEHIDNAIRCSGSRCMIAEALADAYGRDRALFIKVDATGIQFSDPDRNRRFVYFHTAKTHNAFMLWDQGVRVEPFVFTLRDGQVRKRNHGGANLPRVPKSKRKTSRKRTRAGMRKFGVCQYPAFMEARKLRHKTTT